MIRFLLLQNKQGQTRFSKWYVPCGDERKQEIQREIFRLVMDRDATKTNFLEFQMFDKTYKVVYRQYAGLFFSICINPEDNELAHLESIHFFVGLLDKYFPSACELDLIMNFHKVYSIIDEFILAGELLDTDHDAILNRVKQNEAHAKGLAI